MQIKPSSSDFKKWVACVPGDRDLIFLSELIPILPEEAFKVLPVEEVQAQGLTVWKLNSRSWYGYALNNSSYCICLPKGGLERLDQKLRNHLAEEQFRLMVPTVFKDSSLLGSLKSKLVQFEGGYWITSLAWSHLSEDDQLRLIKLWAMRSGMEEYESVSLNDLAAGARAELVRIGYDRLLNQYPKCSGPNCFAAVAGAVVTENRFQILNMWLHWDQLEQILGIHEFEATDSQAPQVGDVLVFSRNDVPVHAGYFLGDGLYFEKPGQDFYEPYRVEAYNNWRAAWPEARLGLWRKQRVEVCE